MAVVAAEIGGELLGMGAEAGAVGAEAAEGFSMADGLDMAKKAYQGGKAVGDFLGGGDNRSRQQYMNDQYPVYQRSPYDDNYQGGMGFGGPSLGASEGYMFAKDAVNSGAGAIATSEFIEGVQDLFETDKAVERKRQNQQRQDIVSSDLKDRELQRKLAETNNAEMLRRQLKKEELESKYLDREVAQGREPVNPGMSPGRSVAKKDIYPVDFTPAPPLSQTSPYAQGAPSTGFSTQQKTKAFQELAGKALDYANERHKRKQQHVDPDEAMPHDIKHKGEPSTHHNKPVHGKVKHKDKKYHGTTQADHAKELSRARKLAAKEEREKFEAKMLKQELKVAKARDAREAKLKLRKEKLDKAREAKDAMKAELEGLKAKRDKKKGA